MADRRADALVRVATVFNAAEFFTIGFAIVAIGIAVSNFGNSRIVERFGARRVSHTALFAFIIVAAAQVMFAFQPEEQLWHFVPLMAINMALLGFIGSNFGAIAMNPFFNIAGAASSAHGFVRMTTAALLGGAIGYAYDGTARPLALALLASMSLLLNLLWLARMPHSASTPKTSAVHSLPPATTFQTHLGLTQSL